MYHFNTAHCTVVRAVLTDWLTGSRFDLAWFSSLSSESLCIFSLNDAILHLLVSWAWWDWPLTWLTNHRPSVLWHCWLGHPTCKIVRKMTYRPSCVEWDVTRNYSLLPCVAVGIGWSDRERRQDDYLWEFEAKAKAKLEGLQGQGYGPWWHYVWFLMATVYLAIYYGVLLIILATSKRNCL